jgi:hypothetical protein
MFNECLDSSSIQLSLVHTGYNSLAFRRLRPDNSILNRLIDSVEWRANRVRALNIHRM